MKIRKTLFAACALVLTFVLAACGGEGSNRPGGAPPAGGDAGGGAPVGVVATEFAFALDAAQLRAGATTFTLKNDGDAPHDFAIQGEGVEGNTPIVQPGQSASFTAELKPGTYNYLCTVPGHAGLGMQGSFTVQ